MRVYAVIPAFNEEQTIAGVLERTRSFVDEIIVVNDGSSDRTEEIARSRGVEVVNHPINRGLGAALGTGFAAALDAGADIVITLDADDQHDPSEIPKFTKAIQEGADFVIGSRMMTRTGMPWYRQIAQVLGNAATLVLFGAWVTDSQSGFRALNRKSLRSVDCPSLFGSPPGMEVSSELVAETKRLNLKVTEVPIKAIYTEYSLSKGQSFFVGIKTLLKLIMRKIS